MPPMQGDVKRALVWLKRNADRYGIDPNHIVLGGGSAGSHLALLAAYAPYHPSFTPEDVRDMDLSLRGVIDYYNAGDYRPESKVGVTPTAWERRVARLLTRLLEKSTGSEIAVDDTGGWDPQLFLGDQSDERLALYQEISPIVHVGADTPPTLQFMGKHDIYVARSGAVSALHRKLQEAGVPSVYVAFPRTDPPSICSCRSSRPRPIRLCMTWTVFWRSWPHRSTGKTLPALWLGPHLRPLKGLFRKASHFIYPLIISHFIVTHFVGRRILYD